MSLKILLFTLLIIGIASLATVMIQESYSTTFPGENGKIVFRSTQDGNPEIYIMDFDGSNQKRLTFNGSFDDRPRFSPDGQKIVWASQGILNSKIMMMNVDGSGIKVIFEADGFAGRPTWSPDGKKISFFHNREITVMNSDGTEIKEITSGYVGQGRHSWSPDGSKIIFDRSGLGSGTHVFVMDSDGTNAKPLTNNGFRPSWSPEGSKIVFDDAFNGGTIFVMNSDGSNKKALTTGGEKGNSAKFSPDGEKIVFISNRDGKSNVFVMNSDGSNQKNLRNTLNSIDGHPDWQPLVNNSPLCESAQEIPTLLPFFHSNTVITSSSSTTIKNISPPSHKTIEIYLSGIIDPDGDELTINIDAITQDEPTRSNKGDKSPDGFGVGTEIASIRAERDGKGNGRVYEISFTVDDGNGGMCSNSRLIGVPHDKSKSTINSGQIFDSTLP